MAVHRVAAGQRVADHTVHMATMVVGGMVVGEGHQPVVSSLPLLSPPCLRFPLSLLPLWLVSLVVGDEEERVAVEAEVLLVHRMAVEGKVGKLDMAEVQVDMVEGKDLSFEAGHMVDRPMEVADQAEHSLVAYHIEAVVP